MCKIRQCTIQKETHRIFTWKLLIGKTTLRRRRIHYNSQVTRITEIICQCQVLGLTGRKKIQNFSLLLRRRYIYAWLISMPESGWYGRDHRNRMICICWFVITAVITSAWLLGLHVKKSASIHNYLRWRALLVMNAGKDQAVTVGEDHGWSVTMVALCRIEVFRIEEALGWFGTSELIVLGAKSDFNVDQTGSGWIWNDGVSYS